ncbi:MAG: hypothetical protein WDO14_18335 [Bacteroidota bacterium]
MRFIALLFLIIPSLAYSQEAGAQVTVRSRFLADSIRIGEKVPFAVTAKYPKRVNILYPDSSYSFNPFEFESKEYFATKTKDSLSYDSVVYYITSYEIDSIQVFRMPVYVLQGSDCTTVFGAADSIFLKQYVEQVPDSISTQQLPLKTNTDYLNVRWLLNYPIVGYVSASLVVIVLVVWLVFGKRIRRYYTLKRLDKDHVAFLQSFADALQRMQSEFSQLNAERALVVWKKYMERLEERPYTKYSTKEIVQMLDEASLKTALRSIDRMVYGGVASAIDAFDQLREVSRSHYSEKIRKVNNE